MSELEIFKLPYGAFIKVRLEFVLLRDDDLQARIMRIIEGWMIDQKKVWENAVAEAASQGVPEPEEPEYWCTLSYAQIIAQLYKFNTSRGSAKKGKSNGKEVVEGKNNTITRVTVANAMHALIEDKYVLIRPNPNPSKEYEASQYSLNIQLIQEHLSHLPKKPMSYLGSNGRISGMPCKDFLHPPKELEIELGYSPNPPREPNVRGDVNSTYVPRKLNVHEDVKNLHNLIEYKIESSLEKENKTTNADAFRQSSSPQEKIVSYENHQEEKQPAQQQEAEIDPSLFSEQEIKIYTTLLRKEDQQKYLGWLPDERSVYNNLLGKYGYTVPVNITPKVEECIKQLQGEHPTVETFRSIDTYAHKNDQFSSNGQKKPIEKQFYKGRGLKIWDYVREYAGWKSQQVISNQDEGATKKNQQLSREDLMAKALAFPVGMDHTTQQYEDLQNCMMYLQPDDRKEVTKQRLIKQVEQNKQRANASAMVGA